MMIPRKMQRIRNFSFIFLNLFRIHMQIKTLYTFTDRECDDLAISLLIENTLNIIYAWMIDSNRSHTTKLTMTTSVSVSS